MGGYFDNDLVDILLFLEEIELKDKNDKNRFFSNLTPHLDNFPDNICKHKILPQLIRAFEYGDSGSAILAPMFKVTVLKLIKKRFCKKKHCFSLENYWMKLNTRKKLCRVL